MRESLDDVDVLIAGGGPAGSSAAISLLRERPDLRVAIAEAAAPDVWRPGEALVPAARAMLEALGAWRDVLASGARESYETRAVWGSDEPYEREHLFSMHGPAWHVERPAFDAALLSAAQTRGAVVRRGMRVLDATRADDGSWNVAGEDHGARASCRARVLIDATGRDASLARSLGARPAFDDRLIGLALYWSSPAPISAPATLVESAADGWWYSAGLPRDRIVTCWMSDADLVRDAALHDPARLLARLRETRFTSGRVRNAVVEPPLRARSARSHRLDVAAGRGWVAAGDAASAIDPLASAGIARALRSGTFAAYTALDMLRGDLRGVARYRSYIDAEYASYLTLRERYYGDERRWKTEPFWSRRARAA